MRITRVSGLLAILCCAPLLMAQSAMQIQKALTGESERLQTWASEKALVEATKAQNARNVPLAEIQKIDDDWRAGKIRKETLSGACADRLRELMKTKPYFVEAFVMDNQGALVCANEATSDYWQGDEPKWERAFNKGDGHVFIDRPRFDESAKATIGMISLPLKDGGTTIGVIAVGVVADKLQ
jgi:hypothetical protein